MRRSQWTSVIVLGLLLVDCGSSYGQFPFPLKPRHKPPKMKPAPAKVTAEEPTKLVASGYAESSEIAEKYALEDAQKIIVRYFLDQGIMLDWKPSLEYVRTQLIKERSAKVRKFDEPLGPMQEVDLQIQIGPREYHDVLKHDRQFRAQGRMLLLAKIMAGLVVLLGTVAGYFRLEEATKGYLTAVLRVGAIGFVSGIVALILLLG